MNATAIIEQSWFNRFFEYGAAQALDDGVVIPPIYLSVGTEHIPPTIKEVMHTIYGFHSILDYAIFPQHRCHSYYLSFGGSAEGLALELCGSPDGCNQGRGGSASISNQTTARFFGHSGLLGDQVPIGVGYAHASGVTTVIVMGDAAAEEDYVLGALGYAASQNVPTIFICEDNNLSILTEKRIRRSWSIVDVAKAFGINAVELDDEPEQIHRAFKDHAEHARSKPFLINLKCERFLWHAGSGQDGKPSRDPLLEYTLRNGFTLEDALIQQQQETASNIWRNVYEKCGRNYSRSNQATPD